MSEEKYRELCDRQLEIELLVTNDQKKIKKNNAERRRILADSVWRNLKELKLKLARIFSLSLFRVARATLSPFHSICPHSWNNIETFCQYKDQLSIKIFRTLCHEDSKAFILGEPTGVLFSKHQAASTVPLQNALSAFSRPRLSTDSRVSVWSVRQKTIRDNLPCTQNVQFFLFFFLST